MVVSMGRVEFEIRRVAGVLSCQFNASEVLVLVEPEADAASVTAAVQRILAGAAESRPVAVVGGRAAAVSHRKWGVVLAGAAAASLVAASAAAAASGGIDLGGMFSSRGHSHAAALAVAPPAVAPVHIGARWGGRHGSPHPTAVAAVPTTPSALVVPPPGRAAFFISTGWVSHRVTAAPISVPNHEAVTPTKPVPAPQIIRIPLNQPAPSAAAASANTTQTDDEGGPGDHDRVGDAHQSPSARDGKGHDEGSQGTPSGGHGPASGRGESGD